MGVALVYWRWRRVQLELEAEMEAAGGLVALGFEGSSTTGDGSRMRRCARCGSAGDGRWEWR
jgi:hypothetical protein